MSRLAASLLLMMVVLGCGGSTTSDGGWQEYRAWLHSPWVVDFAQDMAAWNASADAGEAAIISAARSLIEDLDDGIVWLDTHPPEPCYADSHRLNMEWMTSMGASLSGMIDAYAAQDVTGVYAAMAVMVEALKVRDRAGGAYDAVRC